MIPAVTCSVHATYLTGKWPEETGIVGNGWYYKDECEVKFWKQSNKLIQAPKIWEEIRKYNPNFTVANMFWWFNMYSTVDFSCTPRPNYLADGRKIPDIYTFPDNLREQLQAELGTFPLFDFWGPRTSIKSSQWIANASKIIEERHRPSMSLVYLPHLDYNCQRHGKDFAKIKKDLLEIDKVCEDLIEFYTRNGVKVIIVSEYGITDVKKSISLNRILRKEGYLGIREERGLELLDPGASKAFAVADHQVAHIYVNDKSKITEIKKLLEKTDGIELILDEEGKRNHKINHERAGDFVVVADKDTWFDYYYWLDDSKAPDFARTVEIHRKPGYDPVEMFLDPKIKLPALTIVGKLLKKKMGFRTLMDVIPLDPSLIKGSHGRIPESKEDWPIIISDEAGKKEIEAVEVYERLISSFVRKREEAITESAKVYQV